MCIRYAHPTGQGSRGQRPIPAFWLARRAMLMWFARGPMRPGSELHVFCLTTLVVGSGLLAPYLCAQFGTELVPDEDVGRPRQPPFISFLGIVAPGKMATDPSLPPKGAVAEVLFEELRPERTPAGPAGEVVTSIKSIYDDQGRLVEETRKEFGSETDTISKYQGARLVSQETTFLNNKVPRLKFWNYWTYDRSGKLTEYKRGSGDALQNHDANFTRDQRGRLTSFDYRQGAKDELFSRTELHYSPDGKTIKIDSLDQTGSVTRSISQEVDGEGHVVEAVIQDRDWRTKNPKPLLRVSFKYDTRGRLVEQTTGDYDFRQPGMENELPPGTVTITYDDVNHTKKNLYSDKEGVFSSTVTLDTTGATVAQSVVTNRAAFRTKLECTYDSHGNWNDCQQVSSGEYLPSQSGKVWRRTITYR